MHANTRDINRCLRTLAEDRGREGKGGGEEEENTCVCMCVRASVNATFLSIREHALVYVYTCTVYTCTPRRPDCTCTHQPVYAFVAEIYTALRCIHPFSERARECRRALSRNFHPPAPENADLLHFSAREREFTFGYGAALSRRVYGCFDGTRQESRGENASFARTHGDRQIDRQIGLLTLGLNLL